MKILASLTAAAFVLVAAGSASAHEARIAWGDLNLSTPAGADAFDARVDAASRKMCRDARRPNSRLSDRSFCRAAVQSEALRALPDVAQADYALSRTPLTV
jgi:UrcA family protein